MTLWLLRPVITHPPGILAKTSVTLLGGQLGHVGVKSVRRRSSSSHKDSRATLGWFMFRRTGCHWPREAEPVLQCPVKAGHQPTGRRSCLIPSQALDYDPVESGHHKFKNQTKPNLKLHSSTFRMYLQRMAGPPVHADARPRPPPPVPGAAAVRVDDGMFPCRTGAC